MPYTQEHKARTRERIVGSARRLFNRHGLTGVSIDEIMADAGLTRGGFYNHFDTKEDLYAEVVQQVLACRKDAEDAVSPPRFNANAKLIQVDINPQEIGHNHPADVGIVGDAGVVLGQLLDAAGSKLKGRYKGWTDHLGAVDKSKLEESEARMSNDSTPIHPLRLCKEVRDFLDRDAILVVDGQEILNYGRQSIPTFEPGHRLNSGPFGTMGVGLPFGLGAKAARPDTQVLVLHGDGSFGLNAMELDTAVRWKLPVVTVVSLNGGWTADPDGNKPGRDLGYTRYDKMAEALGCHGEYVEEPGQILPALERAFASGKPALVNVKTDYRARATTAAFSNYMT